MADEQGVENGCCIYCEDPIEDCSCYCTDCNQLHDDCVCWDEEDEPLEEYEEENMFYDKSTYWVDDLNWDDGTYWAIRPLLNRIKQTLEHIHDQPKLKKDVICVMKMMQAVCDMYEGHHKFYDRDGKTMFEVGRANNYEEDLIHYGEMKAAAEIGHLLTTYYRECHSLFQEDDDGVVQL